MVKETVDVVTLEHSDMYTLGMFRIKEVAKKFKVIYEQCSARGYVAGNCNKCGGKGVRRKQLSLIKENYFSGLVRTISLVKIVSYYTSVMKMLRLSVIQEIV